MIEIRYKENGLDVPLQRYSPPTNKEELAEILQFVKKNVIAIAGDALKEEQGKGFDKDPVVVVDNVKGKPIISVNPLGKIQFISRANVKDMALFAYDAIATKSAFVTGLYRSLNYVFLNGIRIATSRAELETYLTKNTNFKATDRLRFMNVAPYAQMLELQGVSYGRTKPKIGKSKDKKLRSGPTVRKPNGTYFLAHRAIARKYGKNARIKFELLPGNYVGVTVPLPGRQKSGSPWRADYHPKSKYNKGFYIYPTISMTLTPGGSV